MGILDWMAGGSCCMAPRLEPEQRHESAFKSSSSRATSQSRQRRQHANIMAELRINEAHALVDASGGLVWTCRTHQDWVRRCTLCSSARLSMQGHYLPANRCSSASCEAKLGSILPAGIAGHRRAIVGPSPRPSYLP